MRRYLPLLVVAIVGIAAVVGVDGFTNRTESAYAFSAYFPQPGYPIGNNADVQLQINYTAPAPSYFFYVISYQSPSGHAVAGQNRVLVGNFPFSAFVYVPVPVQGVVANAVVYKGSMTEQNLVYNASIIL